MLGLVGCWHDVQWNDDFNDNDVDLEIAPNIFYLSPIVGSVSGDDAGVSVSGSGQAAEPALPVQQVLTIFGLDKDKNKPAEGAHVVVRLPNPEQLMKIAPFGSSSSNSGCVGISESLLTCMLDVKGAAQFAATSTSTTDSNYPLTIKAGLIGTEGKPLATAYVGKPFRNDTSLVIPSISEGTLPQASMPVCAATRSAACGALVRVSNATVRIAAPSQNGEETAALHPSLAVIVSISSTPGSVATGAISAWLSASGSCSGEKLARIQAVTDPATGAAAFSVCVDGQAGSYDVSALAGSSVGAISTKGPTTFRVNSVPTRVVATYKSCSLPTDDSLAGNVQVEVDDCNGRPLVLADQGGDAGATSASPSGISWGIEGETSRHDLVLGSGGLACLSVRAASSGDCETQSPDASVGPLLLDFSSCTGSVQVGYP